MESQILVKLSKKPRKLNGNDGKVKLSGSLCRRKRIPINPIQASFVIKEYYRGNGLAVAFDGVKLIAFSTKQSHLKLLLSPRSHRPTTESKRMFAIRVFLS